MPRKLEQFPAAATSRYPWDDLLDGSPWELVSGEDFTSKASTFMARAARLGVEQVSERAGEQHS
jgi:hypothetical protein